jgi:hypothetical protein
VHIPSRIQVGELLMVGSDWQAEVTSRFGENGFEVRSDLLNGTPIVAGYQSRFRVKWGFTKLHLFIVVASFDEIDSVGFESFSRLALAYAKSRKGWWVRGLQQAIGVVAVGMCSNPSRGALEFAEQMPVREFALLTLPFIVDPSSHTLHYHEGKLVFGAAYQGWMTACTRAVFE